jgi:inner membrane protein
VPTVFTHAIAGAAIASALAPRRYVRAVVVVAAAAAMLPDADIIGHSFGIDYHDVLGHRGITHSLLFAAVVGIGAALLLRRIRRAEPTLRVATCLFVAIASHGLLDAMTSARLGVAFFSPFDVTRYTFSFTPIPAAPLRASALLTHRGALVLASEAIWVLIPAAVVAGAALLVRREVAVASDGKPVTASVGTVEPEARRAAATERTE